MQFSCIEKQSTRFNKNLNRTEHPPCRKTWILLLLGSQDKNHNDKFCKNKYKPFCIWKCFHSFFSSPCQTPRILWTCCTLHFVQKLFGYQCPSESEVFSVKTTYNLTGERTEAWTALSQTKDFLSGRNSLRLAWVAGLTSREKENPIPIVRCWWRALCSLNCSLSVCYLTPYTEWYISSPLPIFVFWQGSKMPFHICSSTFKTHGDPLFRKISKVPSSKSHAEAHSSDCLPVRFRTISPWVSALCCPWLARVPGWVFFSHFFLLSSLQLIHFPPAFSFIICACALLFLLSLPSSRSPTCNFPFFACFSLLSSPFTSPSLFFCTFVCFPFFCPSSCSRLLRAVKPAATSSAWLGNLKW